MKFRLTAITLMLIILAVTICGCNTQNDPIIDTPEASTEEQLSDAEIIDYSKIYGGTINKFKALFTTDGTDDSEGTLGVNEIINMRGSDEALECIGYSIKDISGDDIPELIIGFIDEDNKGSEILALYTYKDNAPVFVFESISRSAYFLMNDGNLFYQGSAGAMYTIFGSYTFAPDTTELTCNDYWFTYEKNENSYEVGYYHNTTGEFDKSVSEELNISEDEFSAKQSALIAKKTQTELTPFSEIVEKNEEQTTQTAESRVIAMFAEDADAFDEYAVFKVDESEYSTIILFLAEGTITDFNFLSLTVTDVDDNGRMTFDTETLYSRDELQEGKPLEVTLTFYGDTPAYGISYKDAAGVTKNYTVTLSGEDGSLILTEF